jgi:hypothetical protein
MCKTTTNRRRQRVKKPTNIINAKARFAAYDDTTATIDNGKIEPTRHTWWRKYPASAIAPFADAIAADLDGISAIDQELRHALQGEVTSAIRLAIDLQGELAPFSRYTDLVMTSLLRCALEGSPAAAMVMGQVIKSCGFDHDRGPLLTGSWATLKAPEGSAIKVDNRAVTQLANTVVDAFWVDDAEFVDEEGWS